MTDNNHGNLTKQKEKLQKPDRPKPVQESVDAANQQYAVPEQMWGSVQIPAAELMLAADQAVLQHVIAHPQALTSKTAPSIQRTVGNRTAQQMIARTVARQQASAKSSFDAKADLELELETIVNRRIGQPTVDHTEQSMRQSHTNVPPPRKARINLPEDEYEQTVFQEEKS